MFSLTYVIQRREGLRGEEERGRCFVIVIAIYKRSLKQIFKNFRLVGIVSPQMRRHSLVEYCFQSNHITVPYLV